MSLSWPQFEVPTITEIVSSTGLSATARPKRSNGDHAPLIIFRYLPCLLCASFSLPGRRRLFSTTDQPPSHTVHPDTIVIAHYVFWI